MGEPSISDRIRGRTHRWTFTDGPTANKTYEHVFGDDGKVSYREIDDSAMSPGTGRSPDQAPREEPPTYAAFDVSPEVVAVSYLGQSGFTLTTVLNFKDHRIVGFASNDKQWFPLRGTFQELETPSRRAVV